MVGVSTPASKAQGLLIRHRQPRVADTHTVSTCALLSPTCMTTLRAGPVPDMIKLFSLKQEKAKEATAGVSKPKIPPGLIRMQKGEYRCHGCRRERCECCACSGRW